MPVVLRQKKEKGVRGPGRQGKEQTAKSHIGQYGISKLQNYKCSGFILRKCKIVTVLLVAH